VLRKDAKIAICAILLLMVVVVIIWGRSPRPDADLALDLEREQATAPPSESVVTFTPDPTPPTAPTPLPATGLDTIRRDAPAHPATDTAPTPPPPPTVMINNVADHATMVHEADDTAPPPTALDNLTRDRAPGPPTAPAAVAPAPRPKRVLAIHTIAKGDNYTRLATRYYRDPDKWRLIFDANKIPPQSLVIGHKITIPNLQPPAAPAPATPAATTPPATPRRTYTVRKGDSFYSIARHVYRDPGKWKKLYEHNRKRLPSPSNPSSLRAGTVIALPDLASAR